ncbi:MAG TPA: efflux transporter outer membrane subunit [Bryobacteraceae bacterium]|nr:efflux transporter outer membrane subunit [Bryobacteraceae bacterium]
MRFSKACLLAVCGLVLAGCTVGPKYTKPSVPSTPAYKEAPPESFKETKDWKQAYPADATLRAKWWEMFNDPQLNALEERIDPSNQTLKMYAARFQEARTAIRFNRASQFPTVSTSPAIDGLRISAHRPNANPSATTSATGDFLLPFDVSYEVDLWGRIRRTVTAAEEEAQATAADLATASLSLHAELAMDYFELRSADAQSRLLDDTVGAYAKALQLTTNRYQGGVAPKSDVAQAQTQLDSTRVQFTEIGVQRAELEHAIAILIGEPPASFTLAPQQSNMAPPPIPVGVPSQLLERRPDIASVERRMAEANEQIGIAQAAFYPTVVLNASGGFEGSSILNWFNWPSRFWAVGPAMLQTLFDAGRRRAAAEGTEANYDANVANYRQTVLTAFQQVEDNLAALRILEREAQQQTDATVSAQETLQLFNNRYQGGVDTYLQVVTAQTTALENERNEVDILRRRMDASVLLIKALGGGWSTANLPTVTSLR